MTNEEAATPRHDTGHEALHRRSPGAATVHRAILLEGKEELERPPMALAWSGLAAGLSMGFSLVAERLLRSKLPESEWATAITKIGYSVGFIFVTLGRQQLYTESTLVATLPWFHEKSSRAFTAMLRLWAIVLLTNLIGAYAFAAVAANTTIFPVDAREAFSAIGHEALRHRFVDDLLKGIVGGWLVALMVWLLPASGEAKFLTILLTTYLIAFGELTHIIAGSVETFYLVASGAATFAEYLIGYMVPVLIGNTIGGVVFVAALNHAQAEAGK